MQHLPRFFQRSKLVFVAVLVFFLTPMLVFAQAAPVIEIQPISGPPGTTVTIFDRGGNRSNPCYAQIGSNRARGIGSMAGSISYVVDPALTAGTVISFWCSATGGAASNRAQFTVTPPVAVDSDGDGIPDNRDACPNQPGTAEAGGCAPSPVPQPQIIQPVLPTSGPCVAATFDPDNVNVRLEPSTESDIVGTLLPTEIYSVIGRNADSSWWQVNAGWVAAFVTRIGGDCTALPQTDGAAAPPAPAASGDLAQPEVGGAQIGVLVPAVQGLTNAGAQMSNCPELVPQLDSLPTFLALSIVGEPDPCAAAQAQIDDLFFNPVVEGTFEVPDCQPELEPVVATYFSLLNTAGEPTRSFLQSLADDPGIFCLLLYDLVIGYITPTTVPDSAHIVPMTLSLCDVGPIQRASLAAKVQGLGISPDSLRIFTGDGACSFYSYLQPLGSTTAANAALYDMVAGSCGELAGPSGKLAFSDAVRGALDAAAGLNQGCPVVQTLANFPLPPDLQPRLPQIALGDGECTGNYRMLATHNGALGAEALYRILKSVDPCGAADSYVYEGSVPLNVVPPPACIQGDSMTVGNAQQNQMVIDQGSSWFQKIAALDRPLDEICAGLPGQGGDFAVVATPTMGAFLANPTPTLPVLVANPTATLPVIAANPTATPEPGVQANPTDTPTPALPEQAAPTQVPQDDGGGLPGDGGGLPGDGGALPVPGAEIAACFGCLPDQSLFPSGRVRTVAVGRDAGGNLGIYALDAAAPRDPATGQYTFVPVSLAGLPAGMALYDFPGGYARSFDGVDDRVIAFFARGGAQNLPPTVRQVQIVPPGVPAGDIVQESISLNFAQIRHYPSSSSSSGGVGLDLQASLVFPPELIPAPYAPAWSADGHTLYMALTDAQGTTSIYALLLAGVGEALTPVLVVPNAFAPAVAPNGRYLAFERNDPTGRNIHAVALNSLQENPITRQEPGTACYGPQFGANSLKIFFTCEAAGARQMFVYGLNGITPIETGIANAQNPVPGETDGFIYFDDGRALYLSAEDGSGAAPVANQDRSGWIEIISVNHTINSPRDG